MQAEINWKKIYSALRWQYFLALSWPVLCIVHLFVSHPCKLNFWASSILSQDFFKTNHSDIVNSDIVISSRNDSRNEHQSLLKMSSLCICNEQNQELSERPDQDFSNNEKDDGKIKCHGFIWYPVLHTCCNTQCLSLSFISSACNS